MPRTYPVELTGAQIFGLADLVRRLGTHTMTQDGDAHLRDDLADALTAFVSLLPEPSDEDGDAYLAAVRAGLLPNWGMDSEPLTETPEERRAKYDARLAAEAKADGAPAKAYEVVWPDGGIYANRHGETVLTAAAARTTAQSTGGTWRAAGNGETPLAGLDENLVHDGVHWIAEGPRGALWIIRWSSATGNMRAWKPPRGRAAFQAAAADLPAARREAARIAALIADGKTKED